MRSADIVRALLVGAAIGLVVAGPVAPSAAAAPSPDEPVSFLVKPAPEASTDPAGSYFLLPAEPGSAVEQVLELRNDSDIPIHLELAAVDALTGSKGGASFGLAADAVERTGAWIALDQTLVALAPDESARVPFVVSVPADARSGDHLAGLSVGEVAEEGPGATPAQGGGASVVIRTRRVVAVQVVVPGPAEPELVIRGVSPVAGPDGLHLEVFIDHVGTALTSGQGTLALPADDLERELAIDTFVPGTSISYRVDWTTQERQGSYAASVEISYDGKVATWEGEVVVGEDVLADLQDRQVDPAADGGWVRLWPYALAGLAALATITLTARWASRRRTHNDAGGG